MWTKNQVTFFQSKGELQQSTCETESEGKSEIC